MKDKILEYKLQISTYGIQEIWLPREAEILTVQLRNHIPYLYALVDSLALPPTEKRGIIIVESERLIHNDIKSYIGTFQLDCDLIYHVFEVLEE